MEDDDEPRSENPAGVPAWMATFADLMTLLMCFFVLLLATSDTNSQKYKRVAGSMANAFGVQALIETVAIPKGTSIIAEEFSSATPEPTPMNEVRQKTTDNERDSLDVQNQDTRAPESGGTRDARKKEILEKIQGLVGETEKEAVKIATALSKEVKEGIIEVETSGRKITVRIKEHGTFPSGSADLTPNFKPVLKIIRQALESRPIFCNNFFVRLHHRFIFRVDRREHYAPIFFADLQLLTLPKMQGLDHVGGNCGNKARAYLA